MCVCKIWYNHTILIASCFADAINSVIPALGYLCIRFGWRMTFIVNTAVCIEFVRQLVIQIQLRKNCFSLSEQLLFFSVP